jgi:hypothetical protein
VAISDLLLDDPFLVGFELDGQWKLSTHLN